MEKLNSLGSSLPPERPPTDQAIEALNGDLSQEFKIAANAVTKLYRVANERNSLLKHRGYLNCVDDLLNILGQQPGLSVDDIHLWCLKQRGEILSHQNGCNNIEAKKNVNSKFDFDFDSTTASNNNNTDVNVPNFRLSTPPLSVEHSNLNPKTKKTRWTIKKQQGCKNIANETHAKEFRNVSLEKQRLEQDVDSQQRRLNTHPAPTKKQKVLSTTLGTSRRKEK